MIFPFDYPRNELDTLCKERIFSFVTMKLPTYDQSDKFAKGDDEETPRHGRSLYKSGTLFEFILFFFICVFLSFFGIILAFCFATSIAAQSGAIAGLGATFVIQPFVYEFYYRNYGHNISSNWCSSYSSSSDDAQILHNCVHRTTIGIRLLLIVFGLIGLVLLYKGFSGYFRSIRSSNTNN